MLKLFPGKRVNLSLDRVEFDKFITYVRCHFNPVYTDNSIMGTLAKSKDPDKMAGSALFTKVKYSKTATQK